MTVAPPESATRSQAIRVLVVDDHPLVRHGLREMLGQTDDLHFVGEAADRDGTLENLKSTAVDVVLLDLSLQKSSGLELLKDVVAQFPGVRVLVLSMHDESLFAHRCLEAGAAGYICKQQHPDEVLNALRTVAGDELYLSAAMSSDLLGRVVGRNARTERSGFVSMLTDREYQVFEALGKGLTVREIAAQLFISRKTVENHRDRIKAKLGLNTANELLRHAVVWNLGASALAGA